MENNQNFQQGFRHDIESDFEADFNDAQDGALHFVVTYLDIDCGRIRTESFDDAASADRFASRCVAGEDGWAVVDAIPAKERRAAA
ncbi:hypothetical protein [Arthrobacter sp. I3]|jgi:hypothetical protein|uniref:hypothetical protein n=1 Tax=Arthrobacter sp. I3 TaxID=218158 RepID=UPI0004BB7CDD|nr:hypothetical protein [Arthrobacter sp. I3]